MKTLTQTIKTEAEDMVNLKWKLNINGEADMCFGFWRGKDKKES